LISNVNRRADSTSWIARIADRVFPPASAVQRKIYSAENSLQVSSGLCRLILRPASNVYQSSFEGETTTQVLMCSSLLADRATIKEIPKLHTLT
jgi:hypothetical protein